MDMTYNNFLYEGYWWLSLLGALHCIGLGIYIRYIYRDRNDNHKLLGAIFSLLALYFLTGLIAKHNTPIPLQLVFILIIPAYFLLMPMLYLYCYRSLHNIKRNISLSRHFYPAIALALLNTMVFLFSPDFHAKIAGMPQQSMSHVTLLGAIQPALLSLQTIIYFALILRLLKRFKGKAQRAHQDSLKDIKFRWLLALTLAMMSNWLVRTFLVILPFYFGDSVSVTAQASTRLFLLLTVYVLALYGLRQITMAAFIRGKLTRPTQTRAAQKTSEQLLNSEELNYLQQIHQNDNKNEQI